MRERVSQPRWSGALPGSSPARSRYAQGLMVKQEKKKKKEPPRQQLGRQRASHRDKQMEKDQVGHLVPLTADKGLLPAVYLGGVCPVRCSLSGTTHSLLHFSGEDCLQQNPSPWQEASPASFFSPSAFVPSHLSTSGPTIESPARFRGSPRAGVLRSTAHL